MKEVSEPVSSQLGRWSGRSIGLYAVSSLGFSAVLGLSVAWRLGVLSLIVSGLIGAGLLFAHFIERYAFPLLEAATSATLPYLQERDYRLTRSISRTLEGISTEIPLVILLAGAVMGGVWLFFGMLEDVVTGDPLVVVDHAVFRVLQSLRTPIADVAMIAVTELGGRMVIIAVVMVSSISFLVIRRWRLALYLVVAALGSTVFVHGMKLVLHRPRPLELYQGISEFSFPSGHATSSAVVYGFLSILLARSASPGLRAALVRSALSLVLLIAFSHLYLGAHWLSDVAAGLSFGVAWIAALTILCFRQDRAPLPSLPLAIVLAATVIVVGALQIRRTHVPDTERYAPRTVMPTGKAEPQ